MSQMSPLRRKVLTAMASDAGRWVRIFAGPAIIAGALISGGWAYLFIILGLMMFVGGVTNFCPARGMLAKADISLAFETSFENRNVLGKAATKPAPKRG
jgi:hypothetical protein